MDVPLRRSSYGFILFGNFVGKRSNNIWNKIMVLNSSLDFLFVFLICLLFKPLCTNIEFNKKMQPLMRAAGFIIFRRMPEIQFLLLQANYAKFHWSPPKGGLI